MYAQQQHLTLEIIEENPSAIIITIIYYKLMDKHALTFLTLRSKIASKARRRYSDIMSLDRNAQQGWTM
jgi:hypothetical protein